MASEDFVAWYVDQVYRYWDQDLVTTGPVFNSTVHNASWAGDPNKAKVSDEWLPVSKPFAARAPSCFGKLADVEGSDALRTFTLGVLKGKGEAP